MSTRRAVVIALAAFFGTLALTLGLTLLSLAGILPR